MVLVVVIIRIIIIVVSCCVIAYVIISCDWWWSSLSWMDYCRWIRTVWCWWWRLDWIKSIVVNRWWHGMVWWNYVQWQCDVGVMLLSHHTQLNSIPFPTTSMKLNTCRCIFCYQVRWEWQRQYNITHILPADDSVTTIHDDVVMMLLSVLYVGCDE